MLFEHHQVLPEPAELVLVALRTSYEVHQVLLKLAPQVLVAHTIELCRRGVGGAF